MSNFYRATAVSLLMAASMQVSAESIAEAALASMHQPLRHHESHQTTQEEELGAANAMAAMINVLRDPSINVRPNSSSKTTPRRVLSRGAVAQDALNTMFDPATRASVSD